MTETMTSFNNEMMKRDKISDTASETDDGVQGAQNVPTDDDHISLDKSVEKHGEILESDLIERPGSATSFYDCLDLQAPLNEIIITQPIVSQNKLDSPSQCARPASLLGGPLIASKSQFLDGQVDQRQKMEAKKDDHGERCGGYWLCCWPMNQYPNTGANYSESNWGGTGTDDGCCDCFYGDCGDCCECGDCGDGDCGDCDFG